MSHALLVNDPITVGIFELLCRKSCDISRLASDLDAGISKKLFMSVTDLHGWQDTWLSFWQAGNAEYCSHGLQRIREQAQEARRRDAYPKTIESARYLQYIDEELGDSAKKLWVSYEASVPELSQPERIKLSVEIRDLQTALRPLRNRVEIALHRAADVLCILDVLSLPEDQLEALLAPLKSPSDAEIRTAIGGITNRLVELYQERQLAVQEAANAVELACTTWFSGTLPRHVQQETLQKLCDHQQIMERQELVQRELLQSIEEHDDVAHPRALIAADGVFEISHLCAGLDTCKKTLLEVDELRKAVLESQRKADGLMRHLTR